MPALALLAHWHPTRETPARTVLAVGGVSLALTLLAALTGNGFGAMVDYMTPVYWLFIAGGMAASIRLRLRHPDVDRPLKTPLFPLFPASFLLLSFYMLWSAFQHLGWGAVFGAVILGAGFVLDALLRAKPVSYTHLPHHPTQHLRRGH